jgi:large subunit ribosomal protein L4
MEVSVKDMTGKQVKTVDLPADIFEVEVNVGLMHQAYVRQMANARLGTAKVQRRAEVSRTSAKWYRQKGTGRARHGSRDATQFVGGGRPKGPRPHSHAVQMPKKMRRQAIRCALSALLRDAQVIVVDTINLETPNTRQMRQALDAVVGSGNSALVLLADRNEAVERSIMNLADARYLRASYLNIRDLLQYDRVVIPLDALDVITGIWGQEK